jgi:hypothetical protein
VYEGVLSVCMCYGGGRVEIGINAISTVICMLVKSLGTSFSHKLQ